MIGHLFETKRCNKRLTDHLENPETKRIHHPVNLAMKLCKI